jgi:DNA-binding response OmpR family regulator
LIVEDDRPFADALAGILGLEGYDVLTANSAKDGVQLGLENFPDVIIADWMLKSEMNGGEVCRRIHDVCPGIKTIMMTGHQEHVFQAAQCCKKVEEVIVKPFHSKEILDAVRMALADGVVPKM